MRARELRSGALFSHVSCEARIPNDDALRPIRKIVDGAPGALPPELAKPLTRWQKPTPVPEVSAPSRRTDAARPPVGVLLYLVSVGLVAAAITAVCFGIGLFLLAPPARETITDSERYLARAHGNAPDAGRAAVMAGELPAETASVSEPASSSAVSPPAPTPLPSSPRSVVFLGGAKGHPARYGRGAHARTASQHPRPRSARSAPTLTPPPSAVAQTLTPPQTISFGQLLTQLTGKPVDHAPTPPQPEPADPLAQRVWNK